MALRGKLQSANDALSEPGRFALPPGLINMGLAAWLIVGATLALLIGASFIMLSAGISIPLILAVVVGTVAYPLAESIQARGASATMAAVAVLVGLGVVISLTVWLAAAGVVKQWPEIVASVQSGIDEVVVVAEEAGLDGSQVEAAAEEVATADSTASTSALRGVVSSVFSSLASGLSGIFGFFFGVFISVTLLYYILHDFPTLREWLGLHIGLPPDLGAGIVDDGVDSLRGYFKATTLTGMCVAITIAIGTLLLGVPLAIPIGLVTFVTCYIPYFGAIFSGAFAFLIALGTGGLTKAIALLVIVLVAQNVLQTVISARFMGESLSLHPIVVLVVTMLGGTFAGLLGAALAAPITALSVRALARLRSYESAGLLAQAELADEMAKATAD